MSQAVVRFPISPMLLPDDVMARAGVGDREARRICRVYGVRLGGRPKSPLAIHRDKLEAYLMNPSEFEEQEAREKRKRDEMLKKQRRRKSTKERMDT